MITLEPRSLARPKRLGAFAGCCLGQPCSERSGNEDDQPGRPTPAHQRGEGQEGEAEVARLADRAGPHRGDEGRQQQADNRSVDPGQGRLRPGVAAQADPEGQGAGNQQEGWREHREQTQHSAEGAVRGAVHRRAEKGGEGEERAGNRLRGGVAGEEEVAAHPARGDHFRLQERQHHVAAAEDQRAGAVEGVDAFDGRAAAPKRTKAGTGKR